MRLENPDCQAVPGIKRFLQNQIPILNLLHAHHLVGIDEAEVVAISDGHAKLSLPGHPLSA